MSVDQYISEHGQIVDFFGCIPTLYATLRITGACNLYCKHCYANASSNIDTSHELSFLEWKKVLSDLSNNGKRRLSISGGEPFCRQDIYDIIRCAFEEKFDIFISTNGTCHIDFDKLRGIRISTFQVSIDGLSHTHDFIRGKSGAFEKSTSLLDELVKSGISDNVGVAFSLMRCNVDEAILLFDYLNENRLANTFSIIPVQKLGRANSTDILDTVTLKKVLDSIAEHYLSSDKSLSLNIMVPPALVPLSISHTKFGMGYICEFPYSIAIDANGNCSVCDGLLNRKEFQLFNVRTTRDYIASLQSDESTNVWQYADASRLMGVCSKCKFVDLCCGGCRVDAFETTNDYYSSDPLCQRYFDEGVFPTEYLIEK